MGDEIVSRSKSNSGAREKRSIATFGEKSERCKRVKMRDLDPICRSEDIAKAKTTNEVVEPGITSFHLNFEMQGFNNIAGVNHDSAFDESKGLSWDLNADDSSDPSNGNPFFPFKTREHLKSRDVSECGSTTGPLKDQDPMRVWEEMKQNGFLSSSHGVATLPKQRGRKSRNDVLKKKMELAKKEQVDRFAKIAAPSGLLNELNPGIINHVRNRKQVHSIIEALVRLEKHENLQSVGKQGVSTGINQIGVLRDGSSGTLLTSQHTSGLSPFSLDQSATYSNSNKVERRVFDQIPCYSQSKRVSDDDALKLKLSSVTTMASEDISSLSTEEANFSIVSSLSVKAASVAFQWLELLQQDIQGRLAALKRSKKRVQSVINTELPFLMSREFSGNQESVHSEENADAHRAKWSALFDQMDRDLCEEEKQLKIWLNQVRDMQLHCGKGLHQIHFSSLLCSQQLGTSERDHRLEEVNRSERELAVMAAAASIYSTCNFSSSAGNLPCF